VKNMTTETQLEEIIQLLKEILRQLQSLESAVYSQL